ncbi:UNVERIFIED_CONTAM: hypothetical protein K2H54_062348 [Gekko kuhli]
MADVPLSQDGETALTRYDFFQAMQELKQDISEQIQQSVHEAIQPLPEELKSITETLIEVSQATETALEGAMAAHQDIPTLQKAEDFQASEPEPIHDAETFQRWIQVKSKRKT